MAFDLQKAGLVCIALEDGESLRKAAASVGEAAITILNWTKSNPEFLIQYTRAREMGYRLLADEILDIADEVDVEAKYEGDDVRLELSATAVARNRLRVDTRKWMLSKMLPKIYGDKLQIQGDEENPIQTVTRIELVPMRGNNTD